MLYEYYVVISTAQIANFEQITTYICCSLQS